MNWLNLMTAIGMRVAGREAAKDRSGTLQPAVNRADEAGAVLHRCQSRESTNAPQPVFDIESEDAGVGLAMHVQGARRG